MLPPTSAYPSPPPQPASRKAPITTVERIASSRTGPEAYTWGAMTPTPEEMVRRAVAGERRWLARAITLIETRSPGIGHALAEVSVRRREGPGKPHVVGLTGPPGAGK